MTNNWNGWLIPAFKGWFLCRAGQIVVLLVILLGLVCGCGGGEGEVGGEAGFEVEKEYERGPLTVQVKVDKSQISIADTVRLRLEAIIDQGYEMDMPSLGEALGENVLGILDFRSLPDKLMEEDRLWMGREYRLEPIVSGKYPIPVLRFKFREKNPPADSEEGLKEYELETEEIEIEVTSLLEGDRSELTIADIKDVALMRRRGGRWWMWAGGAVAAVMVASVVVWLMKRRKVKEVRIMMAAHQVAYNRLNQLVADDLMGAGQVKEFYERISNILRWYIEHRFNLKAPERTTEEFLLEVGATEVLTGKQKEMLGKFLEHCDMVKFARYGPSKREIQTTFDLTKEFIESTKVQEKQVDVTGAGGGPGAEAVLRSA